MKDIETYILKKMKELQDKKFFGKIVMEYKGGQVVLIRQEETIKPPID